MAGHIDLNGVWKARGFGGEQGQPGQFTGIACDERTFMDASVPGEIHLDLQSAGLLEDTNYGLNARAARWVEEQVWVYRRTFVAPAEALQGRAWLVFEGLDLVASVYLNGEEIARHANAFTPLRAEVAGKLREGENTLAVQLEGGLYWVSEKPGEAYQTALDHRLHKRSWLRKPQCSFSWDWSPRLVNVGIWRPVRLEWADTPRIEAIVVTPELADDHRTATVKASVIVDAPGEFAQASLRVDVEEAGLSTDVRLGLPAGSSQHMVSLEVADPDLWWPIGHGRQALYTVQVQLVLDGQVVDAAVRRTGIRSIRINQEPHPDGGRFFRLEINGVPIFAKGANWVPPDTIFARIRREHYRELVEMAVQANFNALRIWGGGLYADHALLDACDELGIIVWHDFIFACSKYPGDDPEFLNNVRAEVTHIVRELSAHPSLAVWCGNNELEWGVWDWGYDRIKSYPDYAIYHHEIPRILRAEDPSRPYWPSSPYSPDHVHPNDPTVGDQHPWGVSLQVHGTNYWAYRDDVSRFPNEGGVLGAVSPATVRQYLPDDQRNRYSPAWLFHDNSCNHWASDRLCERFFADWMGQDPDSVSFDDYLFYSAMLQAEGLQEYINNYRRRMFSSASAIFWMYNDCWPASHSWALVDYFLRRKLAYHPVRRAFQPVSVIPAITGQTVSVFGVNDTLERWVGQAAFGLFALSGGYPLAREQDVELAPNASTLLSSFPVEEWDRVGVQDCAAFALLRKDGDLVAQQRLLRAPFKDLHLAPSEIHVSRDKDQAVFRSDAFIWGVCLDVDGEQPLADDVFDLLPGVEYRVPDAARGGLPQPQRVASRLPWK